MPDVAYHAIGFVILCLLFDGITDFRLKKSEILSMVAVVAIGKEVADILQDGLVLSALGWDVAGDAIGAFIFMAFWRRD